MYKLLIVDDEQMVLDWLYWLFSDLTELELDIYRANTAMEAIQIMDQYQMHIVLTDIHMPEMNGMQLLAHIRENWPDCKVIFLTGHGEFDYVYKAIKYDGVSYLLKAEDDTEIVKAVEKAIVEIKQSYYNVALMDKAKQQMEMALPLLQQEFLFELFSKVTDTRPITQHQLNELRIPLDCNCPVILLIGSFSPLSKVSRELSRVEKSQLFYTAKLMAEQYLFVHTTAAYVLCEDTYMTWIIQPDSSQLNDEVYLAWERPLRFVQENLETIQKMCKESLGLSVSFAMGNELIEWGLILEKYQKLKQLLHSTFMAESGIVITENGAKGTETALAPQHEPENLWIHKTAALANYLDRGQKEDFYTLLLEMTRYLITVRSMHHIPALSLYFSLSLMFLSYIERWGIVEQLAFKIGFYKLLSIEYFDSWADAATYLHQLADTIFDLREDEKGRKDRDLISRIQGYIQDHLAEDISLVRLADLAGFNPSYLSRMFKQMTGTNISDYIFQARLEKAKELLALKHLKVQEIAAMVGFESPAYFSKFFKKATSMTPQGYRDTLNLWKEN